MQQLIMRPPLKIYGRHSADSANALAEAKIDASESVGALADALVAKLQLGVAPNRVVLTLVDEGGAIIKVLADAKATLEAAGVASGATVVVSVRDLPPSFPALPPPLVFDDTEVGSERMMVVELPLGHVGSSAPFFLTRAQHREMERFIDEAPSTREQLLMASGTIKSGKTKVVHTVLPGLLSAAYADKSRWQSARLRPVIFTYSFPLGMNAEAAAMHLEEAVARFGHTINVPFDMDPTPRAALANLPTALLEFASRIQARGGELWQFWDELQGPVLGSTPAMAQYFINTFKHVSARGVPCGDRNWSHVTLHRTCTPPTPPSQQHIESAPPRPLLPLQIVAKCAPLGRLVVTGSGMASLLDGIRTARANGYVLWQAVSHVSLGREPPADAALAMTSRLLMAYSTAWPRDATTRITAQLLRDSLARDAHGDLTSTRPALVAYMLERMGDARRGGGAVDVLVNAQRAVVQKLLAESTRDTACALTSMRTNERIELRAVASGARRFDDLDKCFSSASSMPEFIAVLSEAGSGGDVVRLQTPYASLLLSWIASDGQMAVAVDGDDIDLPLVVRNNFKCISENRAVVDRHVKARASRAVLASLAANGLGVVGKDGAVRPPATSAEFDTIHALASLRTLLDASYLQRKGHGAYEPSLSQALRRAAAPRAAATKPAVATAFAAIGWELLLSFCHFEAHIWLKVPQLTRNGLTASVIVDAHGAVLSAVCGPRGPFHVNEHDGTLTVVSESHPSAALWR